MTPATVAHETDRVSSRECLRHWQRFVRAQSHILRQAPSLLFQQACNESDASPVARAAARRSLDGRETRPWLRWANKQPVRDACRVTLSGHTDRVEACAISPDGMFIVSGSTDGTLKVWDTNTGMERATLIGHEGPVTYCTFSHDGSFAMSASGEGANTVKIWDSATWAVRATLAGWGPVSARPLAISPDGTFFVVCVGDAMKICESSSGAERAVLNESANLISCYITAGATLIVCEENYSAWYDRRLKIWDSSNGSLKGTLSGWQSWGISADGSVIVSLGDEQLTVLDVATWEIRKTLRFNHEYPDACAISPDGSFVVVSFRSYVVKIYDAATLAERAEMRHDLPFGRSLVMISANSSIVAMASDSGIKVWDIATMAERATLRGGSHGLPRCTISPDGAFVVVLI